MAVLDSARLRAVVGLRGGGVVRSRSRLMAGECAAARDTAVTPGFWRFVARGSSSWVLAGRGRFPAVNLHSCPNSFRRFMNLNLTRSKGWRSFEVVFPPVLEDGLGLMARFAVLDAALLEDSDMPSPDFLGRVLEAGSVPALGRGERAELPEAGGFIPAEETDLEALSAGVRVTPNLALSALRRRSSRASAASASSMTFGRVGLSSGGNCGADVVGLAGRD